MMRSVLLLPCLLLFAASFPALGQNRHVESADKPEAADTVRFDPVVRDIEGWTVHIDPAMLDGDHQEEGARALVMLANHLQRIKILVPPDQLVGHVQIGAFNDENTFLPGIAVLR